MAFFSSFLLFFLLCSDAKCKSEATSRAQFPTTSSSTSRDKRNEKNEFEMSLCDLRCTRLLVDKFVREPIAS